jgi:hypothetical protein
VIEDAGLSAIKAKIKRDGHLTTKAGIVRRRLGRPGAEPKHIASAVSISSLLISTPFGGGKKTDTRRCLTPEHRQ